MEVSMGLAVKWLGLEVTRIASARLLFFAIPIGVPRRDVHDHTVHSGSGDRGKAQAAAREVWPSILTSCRVPEFLNMWKLMATA